MYAWVPARAGAHGRSWVGGCWRAEPSVADHALRRYGIAALRIRTARAEVVIAPRTRRGIAVEVGPVPRIKRWPLLRLQVGPVPCRRAGRARDQRLQTLIGGRVAAHVEPVEVQDATQALDRLARHRGLGAAKLAQRRRCHQA